MEAAWAWVAWVKGGVAGPGGQAQGRGQDMLLILERGRRGGGRQAC